MSNKKIKPSNQKIVIDKDTLNQFYNLPKMFGIVMLVFVVFYFVTLLITKNIDNKPTNNDTNNPIAVIQYDEIIAGETFNKLDKEYYVLFYDFKGDDSIIYKSVVNTYSGNTSVTVPVYIVDLSKGFNKSFIKDQSNPQVTDISNLQIKGPTLIKIKAGVNTLYKEGSTAIIETLD